MFNEALDDHEQFWSELMTELNGSSIIVAKPLADGCSAGVVKLSSAAELRTYIQALRKKKTQIKGRHFKELGKDQPVELPILSFLGPASILFEEFIPTKEVKVKYSDSEDKAAKLEYSSDPKWIEVTVGVLGAQDSMRALPPSLPIAEQGVLSVEEKFMGGTGTNITLPYHGLTESDVVKQTQGLISHVANKLGISGYARIDAFMDCITGNIKVIEANSLPGLTASTVLYQQALEGDTPLDPRELLEEIINLGIARHRESRGRK